MTASTTRRTLYRTVRTALCVLLVAATSCSPARQADDAEAVRAPLPASAPPASEPPPAPPPIPSLEPPASPTPPTIATAPATPAEPVAPVEPEPAPEVSAPGPTAPDGLPVEIPIRLVRAVDDTGTEGFEATAAAVLTDPRGWQQAGFRFSFSEQAPYTVVLAEGPDVDAACAPYRTGGRFSCQIGPVVALNADRWRTAVEEWPATLEEYRAMLVNHEVGHLIGQHHPVVRCGAPGAAAPVMAQQSGGLQGCAPNPWPLPWELACAARHEEPIAPGYEANAPPLCGPQDVAPS